MKNIFLLFISIVLLGIAFELYQFNIMNRYKFSPTTNVLCVFDSKDNRIYFYTAIDGYFYFDHPKHDATVEPHKVFINELPWKYNYLIIIHQLIRNMQQINFFYIDAPYPIN